MIEFYNFRSLDIPSNDYAPETIPSTDFVVHQVILFVVTVSDIIMAMLNLKTGICSTVIISVLCCTPYAMYAMHSDTET